MGVQGPMTAGDSPSSSVSQGNREIPAPLPHHENFPERAG